MGRFRMILGMPEKSFTLKYFATKKTQVTFRLRYFNVSGLVDIKFITEQFICLGDLFPHPQSDQTSHYDKINQRSFVNKLFWLEQTTGPGHQHYSKLVQALPHDKYNVAQHPACIVEAKKK